MADLASETPDREAPFGAAGSALTPSEQAVRFINSEVLHPPDQGSVSFVKPFAEQVAVMALEDGRSFLQGLEQVLLVAIAKALEQLLAGGAAPATAPVGEAVDSAALPTTALAAAERMMDRLPRFHAALAETVLRVRTRNEQASSPSG